MYRKQHLLLCVLCDDDQYHDSESGVTWFTPSVVSTIGCKTKIANIFDFSPNFSCLVNQKSKLEFFNK
jgi:hypothetical protein